MLFYNTPWRVYTVSNFVYIHIQGIHLPSADSWASVTCPYTLPDEYRPVATLQFPLITGNGGSWTGCAAVTKEGNIIAQNYGNSGSTESRCGMLLFPIGIGRDIS